LILHRKTTTELPVNQIFAISLDHPILDQRRWPAVVAGVHDRLLTPLGLSLAPDSPEYKPHYFGGLRAGDAAYHEGTVWAWLIGPFIDAWLKVHPDEMATARHFLDAFEPSSRKSVLARSARLSMPRRPSLPAVASPKPGASPRFYASR